MIAGLIKDLSYAYELKNPSYRVEVLQPLLGFSDCALHIANFDLWVIPLGMQTISYNSACITVTKKKAGINLVANITFILLTYNAECIY